MEEFIRGFITLIDLILSILITVYVIKSLKEINESIIDIKMITAKISNRIEKDEAKKEELKNKIKELEEKIIKNTPE